MSLNTDTTATGTLGGAWKLAWNNLNTAQRTALLFKDVRIYNSLPDASIRDKYNEVGWGSNFDKALTTVRMSSYNPNQSKPNNPVVGSNYGEGTVTQKTANPTIQPVNNNTTKETLPSAAKSKTLWYVLGGFGAVGIGCFGAMGGL